MLTLTSNSTTFQAIRQALRAMFDEGITSDLANPSRKHRHVWWLDEEAYYNDGSWDDWQWDEQPENEDAYWNDDYQEWGDPSSYDDWAFYAPAGHDPPEPLGGPGADGPPDEEEKALLEDDAEAFAVAEKAQKTLQQARDAVAKARQARRYYPSGGKGSPSSAGPPRQPGQRPKGSKSSGKGGPCAACGRLGHRYWECRDRGKGSGKKGFPSKGKGKGKGKKGPSKGSGEYFYDAGYAYSFLLSVVADEDYEYVPEMPLADSFVLSVGQEALGGRMKASQVIVDTGATESACGIRTMERFLERFLEASKCRYDVSLDDRPTFRLVDLYTPALGMVSVYIFDHPTSQDTPLLLGGRTLRQLKATVNYGDETLMFLRRGGQVALLPLVSTLGGHMVVDLAMRSTPLGPVQDYLEKKLGVVFPGDRGSVQDTLRTPGFSDECRRGSGRSTPGTDEDDAAPGIGAALQIMQPTMENSCSGVAEEPCAIKLCHGRASQTCQCAASESLCEQRVAYAFPILPSYTSDREEHDSHSRMCSLRLKLDRLRERQHERPFPAPSVSDRRSQMVRLAVRGRAQGRGTEIKSVCSAGPSPEVVATAIAWSSRPTR